MDRVKDAFHIETKGKRKYGGWYRLPTGSEVYMAWRNERDIFRAGKPTTSEALREGVACWALDEELLLKLRSKGIRFVGVWLKDTDDRYLTTVETFFDRTKAKILDYSVRGGSLQRYLPLEFFRAETGRVRVKATRKPRASR